MQNLTTCDQIYQSKRLLEIVGIERLPLTSSEIRISKVWKFGFLEYQRQKYSRNHIFWNISVLWKWFDFSSVDMQYTVYCLFTSILYICNTMHKKLSTVYIVSIVTAPLMLTRSR